MNSEKSFTEKIEQLEKRISELETKPNGIKNYFKKAFRKTNVIIGIAAAALATGIILYAAQITFTDGTVISAADVNSNFKQLFDKTSALESKILGDVVGADTSATVNYAAWNDIPDMSLNINCAEDSTVMIMYETGLAYLNNGPSRSYTLNGNYRILIDNVEQKKTANVTSNWTTLSPLLLSISLSQGSHTIKVQWKQYDSSQNTSTIMNYTSSLYDPATNFFYSTNTPRRLTVVKL